MAASSGGSPPAASAQAAKVQPNSAAAKQDDDPANAGLRREPGLEPHKDIAPAKEPQPVNEFDPDSDEPEQESANNRTLVRNMRQMARQISLDPGDGMEL
jgi:type IV secretion system protein VirD4